MSKREQTPEKRTQIVVAAASVLTKRGLQALSFETVAAEADLSRQLVRYYYPAMDALVVELCDYLGDAYRRSLVAGIVELNQFQRLNFFLDYFFDLADGFPMPENLETYDALVAYSVGCAELRERMCGHYHTLGKVVAHELAIAHPSLTGSACEEISFMFVSMMHAHWSFVASLGHSREHSRLARKSIDRLIQSYINDAPNTPVIAKPWARDK